MVGRWVFQMWGIVKAALHARDRGHGACYTFSPFPIDPS